MFIVVIFATDVKQKSFASGQSFYHLYKIKVFEEFFKKYLLFIFISIVKFVLLLFIEDREDREDRRQKIAIIFTRISANNKRKSVEKIRSYRQIQPIETANLSIQQ